MNKKASTTRIVGAVHVTNRVRAGKDVQSVQSLAAKVRDSGIKSQKSK